METDTILYPSKDGTITLKINGNDETFNLKNVLDIAELYHIAKNKVITLELNLDMNQQCSKSSEESVGHYNKITPFIRKWYRIKRQMKKL